MSRLGIRISVLLQEAVFEVIITLLKRAVVPNWCCAGHSIPRVFAKDEALKKRMIM